MSKLYAKFALKNRLDFLQDLDVDGFELQMMNDMDFGLSPEMLVNTYKDKLKNVKMVHSPLFIAKDGRLQDCTLVNCDNKQTEFAFEFANYLGEVQDRLVPLAIHLSYGIPIGDCVAKCRILQEKLDRYPNVLLLLENTPYVPNLIESDRLEYRIPQNELNLFKAIKQTIGSNRVEFLLDICNMQMNCNNYDFNYSLEDYLKVFKGMAYEIHFSKCIGSGIAREEHSREYTLDDREELGSLIRLIHKYQPSANIVFEILENDYNKFPRVHTMVEAYRIVENELFGLSPEVPTFLNVKRSIIDELPTKESLKSFSKISLKNFIHNKLNGEDINE